MRATLAALLILAPLACHATEPGGAAEGAVREDIPEEEWTALASGRTLSYTIDGRLWALERYAPDSRRVTLQFYDGSCLEGVWEYTAPHYCFHWEGQGTSCFRHVRAGSEILVLETQGGVETGAVQVMGGVTDTPLSCGEPFTS